LKFLQKKHCNASSCFCK